MAVRLYSSDDVGAPVLGTSNDGSLMNILRACLVDGYGTRTPVGWAMPFVDAGLKKIVLKPVTSGVYLRVDDSLHYQYAYVKGFETMSDIDTGTREFPRVQDMTYPNLAVSKRYSTGVDYENWYVIADDEWFYFVTVNNTSTSGIGGFFFGKIDCADVNYTYPFLITGRNVNTSLSISYFEDTIFDPTNDSWWIQEKWSGISEPEEMTLIHDTRSYENPSLLTGKIETRKPDLSSYNTPYVRYGYRPNISRAFNSGIYRTRTKLAINAKKYLLIRHSTSAYLFEYEVETG